MGAILTLKEIARLVEGELRGDGGIEIRAVAPLNAAQSGDLSWIQDDKHIKQLDHCQASALLIGPTTPFNRLPVVVCQKPNLAVTRVLEHFQPPLPHPPIGIDPTAIVAPGVKLGNHVAIGPHVIVQANASIGANTILHGGVFIGQDTVIGNQCLIWPNVVIRERCSIGNRVIIHPNATIGADGFGYNFDQGVFHKIPHVGRVRIEDDVEIGANSCIDRAKMGETLIGRGTKIDNLVQIAHNVQVGQHCCLVAHVGIAGSAKLGNHVTLAGKVGIKDNITIGNGVQGAACSCIAGDVPDGEIMLGTPAIPKHEFFRELSALRKLPVTTQQVRDLIKRVEQLEAANHPKAG